VRAVVLEGQAGSEGILILVKLNIDWIDIAVSGNRFSLNERVSAAYLAAFSVLDKAHLEMIVLCKQQRDAATTQEEYARVICDFGDEDYRWTEQTQALAAMALTLIASTNKSFLDQIKKLFIETCPPDPKGYPGKSELYRYISEYKSRFGVDLETITSFETIREVVLARNCCVHKEGHLDKDYIGQTRQRLVGTHGYIDITPEMLTQFLSEIDQFCHGLAVEMKAVRSRDIAKG
jgi:hypothetical protein